MIKTKSVHNIMIERCQFQTVLQYNINTDHIGISTLHKINTYSTQWSSKHKNKFCIICNKLLINKQRKYCDKCKEIIHQKQISDHYTKLHPDRTKRGSDEFKIKCSCGHKNIDIKDFDGFAKESPYCSKFNELCRESNREKYNRKCFICDKLEIENNRKLSVHHVDMNKQQGCNNTNWALIPVCMNCHNKLHSKLWQSRIEYLLKI